MMKKETLNRYSKIISNCPSYDDMEFVLEKMFKLYVPSEGEIKQFLYDIYKLGKLGSENYRDIEDKLGPLISKLFEDRFERLDSEFDK